MLMASSPSPCMHDTRVSEGSSHYHFPNQLVSKNLTYSTLICDLVFTKPPSPPSSSSSSPPLLDFPPP